jgi:Putative Ig domain
MCAALSINDAPSPGGGSRLPDGMVGDFYTTRLTAAGGSGSYTWAFTGPGTLPAGLGLDAGTGTLSGIPLSAAQGTAVITVAVTDGSDPPVPKAFWLTINPGLQISTDLLKETRDEVQLQATGGADAPRRWETVGDSTLPAWATLDPATGTISITDAARRKESARISIRVTEASTPPHTADISLVLRVRPARLRMRRRLAVILGTMTLGSRVSVIFRLLSHPTFWLSLVAVWVPVTGSIPIILYSVTTPGQRWEYLAVGLLTAVSALVAGCLIGFLFGIPKIAAGKVQLPGKAYTPNTNLPEVSDWLTKLLLGAGLVQLTHLGPPVGRLIDHVSLGLYDSSPVTGSSVAAAAGSSHAGAATVMAGAIIFGYTGIGLLSGYVVTSDWYLKRLNSTQT